MLMTSNMLNIETELNRCNRCGRCMSDCPVYLEAAEESMAARGRLSLVEAYVHGKICLTNRFKHILSKCLLCGACSDACVAGVSVHEIIQWARMEITRKQKMRPLRQFLLQKFLEQDTFISKLLRQGLRVNRQLHFLRKMPCPSKTTFMDNGPSFIPGSQERLKVGYFVGCIANQFFPEVGLSTIHILKDGGCTIYVPRGQECCGLPFFNAGDLDKARSLAMNNMDAMLKQDVHYVITSCAACSSYLKDYKKLFGSDPKAQAFSSKVRDISQFLANELSYARKLRDKPFPAKAKTPKVTYHDPCHLKKRQKVFKEPRNLIQAIQGIDFVEMSAPDRCCGHGGGFHIDHYELSLKILKHKMDDIKETGAHMVVTGCMGCLLQLREGVNLEGLDTKVLHIAQLIDKCKGELS